MTDPRNFGTSRRLRPFGESVFATISRLAAQHGAVNLGQGFPNFDGPAFVKDAAIQAIREGHGQYARTFGLPEATRAIAARWKRSSGLEADPESGPRPMFLRLVDATNC